MSKITVIVTGETGSGKSAIAGEIEIALKAIGVPVEWKDADRENWRHGNEYWIDLYKPEVTIIEQNIPITSLQFKRCPACSRTDQQYKLGMERGHHGICSDPWHTASPMRRTA